MRHEVRCTVAFFALMFVAYPAAANTPPAMLWHFTSPSTMLDKQGEDWLYSIVQTSDGGFLGSGYATDPDVYFGAIIKLDAKHTIEWERTLGKDGYFVGCVETANSYVAVGNAGTTLLIASVAKAGLTTVTHIFTPADLGITQTSVEGYAIRQVLGKNGVDQGFIVVGTAYDTAEPHLPVTSFLLRLDASFQPITTFGKSGKGIVFLPAPAPMYSETVCRKVQLTHNSGGDVTGFITVGRIPQVPEGEIYDMFVETVDTSGNALATERIKINDLSSKGFTSSPAFNSLCPKDVSTQSSTSIIAFDVVEISNGGDFAVLAQANYVKVPSTDHCTNTRLNGGYTDLVPVLVLLKPDLTLRRASKIGHFSGIDFETPLTLMNDGFIVAGNDASQSTSVIRARVIKTNFDGDVMWTGDYSIPGDQNDCVFGVTRTFDDGIVIAGNNDLNGEDYFALKLAADTDLWMHDTDTDTGVEPYAGGGLLYVSPDIWVHTKQAPFPYVDRTFENPEYRDPSLLQPNYVYAAVQNRGSLPASGTVDLYWAKASTGLAWPIDWTGTTKCCNNTTCGGSLQSIQFYDVQPGETRIGSVTWYPPNPADFAGAACGGVEEQGHFCLLARIQTSPDTPYGMTFPEGTSVAVNTANNNNIAWKNVTVVPAGGGKKSGFVRNIFTGAATIGLTLTAAQTNSASLFDYATIDVTLSPELMRSWRNGGRVGTGIQELDDTTIRVLKAGATIDNIAMQSRQTERFAVRLTPRAGAPFRSGPMSFDVTQRGAPTGKTSEIVGGMRFTLLAEPSSNRQRAVRP
jgi:hypothetical protein